MASGGRILLGFGKFLLLLPLLVLSTTVIYLELSRAVAEPSQVQRISWNARVGESSSLGLGPLEMLDRVYLILDTTASVSVKASPGLRPLPFEVEGHPFDFSESSLKEQRLLYIAQDSLQSGELVLQVISPATPYTPRSLGNVTWSIFQGPLGTSFEVNASKQENVGLRFPMLLLITPFHDIVHNDFEVRGELGLVNGRVGSVNLGIVNESERSVFGYVLLSHDATVGTSSFSVNSSSQESYGKTSGLVGDYVSYIYLAIILDLLGTDSGAAGAEVSLGSVTIENEGFSDTLSSTLTETVPIEIVVYRFSKFRPSGNFQAAYTALVGTIGVMIISLVRKEMRRLLGPILRRLRSTDISEPYSNTWSAQAFHKPRYRSLAGLVSRNTKGSITTLLDVGCGQGHLATFLRQNGVRVTAYVGCDIGNGILKSVNEYHANSTVRCDASNLPFQDNTFPATVCSEILEHVPHPDKVLAEILRVSSGRVFLTFPDERLKNLLGLRYHEHVSTPTLRNLLRVASEKGFNPEHVDQIPQIVPPSVFDRLRLPPRIPLIRLYLAMNRLLLMLHMTRIALICTFVIYLTKRP